MARWSLSLVQRMYDYLSVDSPTLQPSGGAFVFGRADELVAQVAAALYFADYVQWMMFTGGSGKDSAELEMPESIFLGGRATAVGVPSDRMIFEVAAAHGGDNVRLGLDVIAAAHLDPRMLTVVAHATSVRRLTMMLAGEIFTRGLRIQLQSVRTPYQFNARLERDALEAAQEIIRMAEWPAKYGYPPNDDLPTELVDHAYYIVNLLGTS